MGLLDQIYQTSLGRTGSAAETGWWQGQIDSGKSIDWVKQAIAASPEAQSRTQTPASPATSTPTNTTTRPTTSTATSSPSNPVNNNLNLGNFYQQTLGRTGSADEINWWQGQLDSGKSADWVKSAIQATPEAQQFQYGYGTDRINAQEGVNPYANNQPNSPAQRDHISNLYATQLGRTGKSEEIDWWMDYANKNGIDQTMRAMQGTSEFKGYQDYLKPPMPETPTQGTTGWQNSPYTAVHRAVNSTTDTVQGQLNDLLRTQNPLMQRAYYQGLDMANSRGLLNSSMASEAAQAAMMDRALPIAQQDASTFYDQGTRNQGYTNQFNLNDRSYLQSAEQANLDRDLSREKMGQADSTLAQSTTANTQGKYLDAINQITQNSMTSINEIEVTPGMTQEDKDAMIANTVARRDADLAWVRQLYSNMPTWDFSWFNIEPGEMPSAPGIGV